MQTAALSTPDFVFVFPVFVFVSVAGIFVLHMQQHFSTQCCARMLLATLLISALTAATTNTELSTAAATAVTATATEDEYECDSIDVRNECDNLLQLQNCTVIRGSLTIVLLPKSQKSLTCAYESYHFPLLREITDFLIFFEVKGLRSIKHLFPNLNVIRGRRLFLNYALGISNMPDLEVLDFKSLIAIQRGHVFIGSNPKLCHLERINWDLLTLSPGQNHIYPEALDTCVKPECRGCQNNYCWSNIECQYFQNDNLVNRTQDIRQCPKECLGGCYNYPNSTPRDCLICRNLTDHGACVEKCSAGTYILEDYQRCYTRDECIKMRFFIHEDKCVKECPGDYAVNESTSECVACADYSNCTKICNPLKPMDPIYIFNLADVERYKDCQIFNCSLIITIRNIINEGDLKHYFRNVVEIVGHLKIFRNPHLKDLTFLGNLQKIHGVPLENNTYALIVYNNKNLTELWTPKQLELVNGGMFIHRNDGICNTKLHTFQNGVIHSKNMDSLQTSDQEVLCDTVKLTLSYEAISHNAIKLSWSKFQTSEQVEIIYRPQPPGQTTKELNDLESDVCNRIRWERRLLFPSELKDNRTHYSYIITGLQQFTAYECLVRTFGTNAKADAASKKEIVTTKLDVPTAPSVEFTNKTDQTLTFRLVSQNQTLESVTYYVLQLYELTDDVAILDRRNYCNQPELPYNEESAAEFASGRWNEDYDDCCARREEELDDDKFKTRMRAEYSCSFDQSHNCIFQEENAAATPQQKPVQYLHLSTNDTQHTLQGLKRYQLYVLQINACNTRGCGAYSMQSVRTNYSLSGNQPEEFRACRVTGGNEYRVSFREPAQPNGIILYYYIHFISAQNSTTIARCVTRLQHAQANYQFVIYLNHSYNVVAVRLNSLAGAMMNHVNITSCPSTAMAGVGITLTSTPSHGLNVFLACFLLGAAGTLLWIIYKRRYWRKLPELCRYIPAFRNWRSIVPQMDITNSSLASMEDRQVLVEEFETVRFHNSANDD